MTPTRAYIVILSDRAQLDIAASLWSVLYLQPLRTPGLISAQAEYQARILPTLADQLRIETSWCAHPRSPAQADPRSKP